MWLVIGDLHLTDHARDEHRFGIFKWIRERQEIIKPAATFLLGDLTDAKDRHSATLVNKIVAGLTSLKPPVYIVCGNHDYSKDQTNPFFNFLNHIEGLQFVTKPTVIKAIKPVAIIPHYRSQDEFDAAVTTCSSGRPACFLVHQTFDGAIAESGVRLSGLSASLIESMKPPLGIYAGDVHRPQTQGLVTYVGCPYQVRFGDNFEPRTIVVDRNGTESYPWFEAPRKWALTIRGADNLLSNKELVSGDQVKLTIEMAREEAVDWKKVKQEVLAACKKLALEVHGLKLEINSVKQQRVKVTGKHSSTETLEMFCKAERVSSQIKQMGIKLLESG